MYPEDIPLAPEREAGAPPNWPAINVGFGRIIVTDEKATSLAGHEVTRERIYVRIGIPGDRLNVVCQPATEEHKRRFPQAWRRFCQGQAATAGGTPLEEWAAIHRSQVRRLKAVHIHTVEQLAEVHDGNVGVLGIGGYELRQKARDQVAGMQAASKAKSEADEKAALQAQLAEMAEQMKAMQAELAKRGGKSKATTTNGGEAHVG